MARKPRKRNYRAEYQRRLERGRLLGYSKRVARGHANTEKSRELGIRAAQFLGVKPGTDIDVVIAKDARHVFGRKPKLKKGTHGTPDYQLRLEEMAKREDGRFDWLNERNFIQQMQALGLTEREAYSAWFSP